MFFENPALLLNMKLYFKKNNELAQQTLGDYEGGVLKVGRGGDFYHRFAQ